jgi:recombination protein RecA
MGFLTTEQVKKLSAHAETGTELLKVNLLPTGIYALDYALGGGIGRGRVCEIAGPGSAGKTTISLTVAANVIANGGYVAYIDGEGVLDGQWGKTMGVPSEEIAPSIDVPNLEDYHFHPYVPQTLDHALELIRKLIDLNLYDLIILDSIGGMTTEEMGAKSVTEANVAARARLLNRFKANVAGPLLHSKTALWFVNQVYENVGNTVIDSSLPFGGTLRWYGGRAMEYLATQRIIMMTAKPVKGEDKKVVGQVFSGKVWKNKVGRNWMEFELRLQFNPTFFIDSLQDLMDTGVMLGVLDRRGAHWYYEGERLAGSEDQMRDYLFDHPDVLQTIAGTVSDKLKGLRDVA